MKKGAKWSWLVIAVVAAVLGLVVGQYSPARSQAGTPPGTEALASVENGFVSVVDRVSPAVVNINTEQQVERPATPSPFDDEFFRRFFGDRMPAPLQPQPRTERQQSLGSGVIIDPKGYVVTNVHVVRGAQQIKVTTSTGDEYDGKVVGTDPLTDLAVVKVNAKKALPAAALGDGDQAKVGSWAIAIGSPFGLEESVTVGVISAKGRSLPTGREGRSFRNLLQTDAAINQGNSGGPLVNIRGEVIGINQAIFTPTGGNIGIGFAISINPETRKILDTLMAGKTFERGQLGVTVRDLSPAMQQQYGVKAGAFVNQVLPDSPAGKAGVKDEDVIVRYDNKPVKDANELVGAVQGTPPGATVPITVVRAGKEMKFEVKVGRLPAETALTPPGEPETEQAVSKLGLRVRPIDQAAVGKYQLKRESGVVVTDVDSAGDAARAGVQPGDVLLKINSTNIKTVADYNRAVAGLQKGGYAIIRVDRRGNIYTLSVEDLEE